MLKRTCFIIVCLLLCTVALGEFQQITFDNVTNDNTLVTILRERLSFGGNSYTFANGLTIDNATNNAMEWTENSESLIWTFGTNDITLTTDTGVTAIDIETIVLEVDSQLFEGQAARPAATEGMFYYDDTNNVMAFRSDSAWVSLGAGTGDNTLDLAYDEGGAGAGRNIQATDGAVDINSVQADTAFLLTLNASPGSSAALGGIEITLGSNSTENGIEFENTGGGDDIQGTGDTWAITAAGALTAVSGTIPTMTVSTSLTAGSGIILDSAESITNAVNSEINFAENSGEDIIFDMDAGTNAVGLKSSTGVDELAMGDVDDLTGVGTIAFDAEDSSISLAADGTDDLTIAVTGVQDTRLLIQSSGTNEDAMALSTSAGGMTLTVAGAAGAEDLTLASNTAVNITSSQASDLAINIATSNGAGQIQITSADTTDDGIEVDSSGGIDIDAVDVINIDNSGSGKDIRVDSAAGRLELVGGEAAATAVVIDAEDAAGGIDMDAGTGGIAVDITGAADFRLDSSAGSIVLIGAQAAFDAITIDAENAAGGIDMDYGTGGMVLTGTGTAANLTIDVDALSFDFTDSSNISITSSEAAEDLTISQIGDNDSSIIITAAGDGANAIELTVSNADGDMDINVGDAVTLDANDILITLTLAAADQFKVNATGTIGDFAINFETSDAGILLNADGGTNGDITLDAASVLNFIAAGGITTSDTFTGDGTAALGGFLRTITNDTEPHAVAITESGTVLTNLGANGADTWQLPNAAAGLEYIFVVMAAQEMQITPQGADNINSGGTALGAGDYYVADAVGEILHIIAVDTTNWIVISETGTWTDENP